VNEGKKKIKKLLPKNRSSPFSVESPCPRVPSRHRPLSHALRSAVCARLFARTYKAESRPIRIKSGLIKANRAKKTGIFMSKSREFTFRRFRGLRRSPLPKSSGRAECRDAQYQISLAGIKITRKTQKRDQRRITNWPSLYR